MRITATSSHKSIDVRKNCGKLNLTAQSHQDQVILTALYHVLTGNAGEPDFEKQRKKLRNQWLRPLKTKCK